MTSRILLVEDDPVSRELIAALLASRGYEVDTADDGFGALRLAQGTRYDLIFVDYHLPEMDGYALARLMRSLGEATNHELKMVAITADRFGLAARRGVDSIFDCVLPKPIEPDDLFAFLDEFLGDGTQDIEAFLAVPEPPADVQDAGQMLWRVRGLAELPRAAAFPQPLPAERDSLDHCFKLVAAEAADALLLLRQSGLPGVETLRAGAKAYLQPLIVLDPKLAPIADVLFQVGDGESWTRTASILKDFAARRADLDPGIAESDDFDTRVAAYLYVAGRSLDLVRDAGGRTMLPYTAGFSAAALIESVKRLAARGLVSAKLDASAPSDERRLTVSLTSKGIAVVAGQGQRAQTAG